MDMQHQNQSSPGLLARLKVALACFSKALSDGAFVNQVTPLLHGVPTTSVTPQVPTPPLPPPPVAVVPTKPSPEELQASALNLLALLQREGRLVDFLQDDVTSYPDADVGAAARIVHSGCRKVLLQTLSLEPVLKESEGAAIQVPLGFDPQRIRVTGNVTGTPPFRGSLKHHGWIATSVKLPTLAASLDARILAPAEVEI